MSLQVLLPGLVCGGGMAACMLLMSRGHGAKSADPTTEQQLANLQAELHDLRARSQKESNAAPSADRSGGTQGD
jgi:hypothetical protein